MELKEITLSKRQEKAICTALIGDAPEQFIEDLFVEEKAIKTPIVGLPIDENFYGDEGFNEDELDEESFSDVDFSEDIDPLK